MERQTVVNPAEPFAKPSDFSGEDTGEASGHEHENQSTGGDASTTVGPVSDEEIRPFIYRPPVGKDGQPEGGHPRRRRSDVSQMR